VYFIVKGAVSECNAYGNQQSVLGPNQFFGVFFFSN
jgi:hypothetical protein